ncbi:hypothetical protein [Vibrio phage PJN101]|nr:hypothetical protein [Vibrio phage PJN101]
MISILLIGFSINVVDGYTLKMCHYRNSSMAQSVSLSVPEDAKCPRKLKIGK